MPRPKPAPIPRRQWHRLFGLVVEDLVGPAGKVEIEPDLSRHRQRLDVAVVLLHAEARPGRMPDGLDDFVRHNLITFKSHHEALDGYALKELSGHSVNYRKHASGRGPLLPEGQFRLYAVSARRPEGLFAALPTTFRGPGVYDVQYGIDAVRVVAACELPRTPNNGGLLVFSGQADAVEYGAEHYHPHPTASGVLGELGAAYRQEGHPMAYTLKQFNRELLAKMPLEERLEGLSPEQLTAQLKPEQVLAQYQPEQLLAQLKPEQVLSRYKPEQLLAQLKPEQVLAGLPPEQIKAFMAKLEDKAKKPSRKRK